MSEIHELGEWTYNLILTLHYSRIIIHNSGLLSAISRPNEAFSRSPSSKPLSSSSLVSVFSPSWDLTSLVTLSVLSRNVSSIAGVRARNNVERETFYFSWRRRRRVACEQFELRLRYACPYGSFLHVKHGCFSMKMTLRLSEESLAQKTLMTYRLSCRAGLQCWL